MSLKKQATSLQALIRAGKSKNKHYNDVVKEVGFLALLKHRMLPQTGVLLSPFLQVEKTFEVSKEKIELAKALIRAAEKAQDKELKKEPKAK